jgi:cytochrome c oxidase cbb3-type subunit 3
MTTKDIDQVTGVETTGHQWDGIKELNKPLPRWWLLTLYATVIWSIGYWVLYPAWPTLASYTKGTLGYSQRTVVAKDVADANAAQKTFRDQLASAPLAQVKSDPDLLRFAMAAGGAAFATNCAPCHGRSAQGAVGYPNLNDDDWIWGGTLDQVMQTVKGGVRSGHKLAREGMMPKYGIDGLLDTGQINDAAEYVLSLSNRSTDSAAAARGKTLFAEQCAGCHGDNAKGNQELGAPSLTDQIWLYGGSKPAIVESIRTGRGGVMPAWEGRLDPIVIKALAVYVHSLGGGK